MSREPITLSPKLRLKRDKDLGPLQELLPGRLPSSTNLPGQERLRVLTTTHLHTHMPINEKDPTARRWQPTPVPTLFPKLRWVKPEKKIVWDEKAQRNLTIAVICFRLYLA